MPYVTIPTQSDGSILSASLLNTLSANQEFLYGQSRQVNTPFVSYRRFTSLIDVDDVYWTITHRLRYLHYKANCQETADHIIIKYGGINIVNVPFTTGIEGFYDLNLITSPALVVGDRYQLIVEIFRPSDNTEMTIDFLVESDSTSI